MVHLTNLKSDVCTGRVQGIQTIVDRFLQLDEEMMVTFVDAPPTWHYEIHPLENKPPGSRLPKYIYLYHNSHSAQLWSSLRNNRITVHSFIVAVLVHQPPQTLTEGLEEQLSRSRGTVWQMQMDILASVPQYLGLEKAPPFEREWPTSDVQSSACLATDMLQVAMDPASDLPIFRSRHDFYLLWNLLLAGQVDEYEGEVRKATCEILNFMGRCCGICQAFHFAAALQENDVASSALGAKNGLGGGWWESLCQFCDQSGCYCPGAAAIDP